MIKPHYRSEGPRQGSCGVFWGCFILSRLLLRVSNCGTCSKFNESKKYLDENISKKLHFHKGSSRPWVPKGPRGTMFLFKRHFFIIRGGRFVDTHLSTEKKPRAKKYPFIMNLERETQNYWSKVVVVV